MKKVLLMIGAPICMALVVRTAATLRRLRGLLAAGFGDVAMRKHGVTL